MKISKILLAGSALVMSGSALAATQGSLGATSSGTSLVTVVKEEAVQISNIDDINLGTHDFLAADAVGSDDVCVFNSTGNYAVTVTSASGSFELQSGTDAVAYGVTWNGADATGGQLTDLAGDVNSPTCNGGTNATFEVTVAVADFNAADSGTYTDTLTLAIVPE